MLMPGFDSCLYRNKLLTGEAPGSTCLISVQPMDAPIAVELKPDNVGSPFTCKIHQMMLSRAVGNMNLSKCKLKITTALCSSVFVVLGVKSRPTGFPIHPGKPGK